MHFLRKSTDGFYEGFQDVALPHKFKIAVGGCPNNCVKPNLNDVGIIGQRIPEVTANSAKAAKNAQLKQHVQMVLPKL